MEKVLNIISFKGKAGRLEYFIIVPVLFILRYLIILFTPLGESWNYFLFSYIIFGWLSLSTTIRRFRDLGKSPWSILILLVPIIGIVFFFMLLFNKGVEKDSEVVSSKILCGHCGRKLRTGASFCSTCGGELKIDKIKQSLF